MSFNVAMLEAMQAEGLDLDACIRVLKAGEKKADPTAAARQRRCRARKASHRDVTRDPPNDNILTPGSEANASSPKGFVRPSDIPGEPWEAFEEMRRRIRKPMTDRARSLAVTELRRLRDEEGWPPGTVLNHCTLNSYQGIYPPRKTGNGGIGKSAQAFAMLNIDPNEPF